MSLLYYCSECNRQTEHFSVTGAAEHAGVSRTTVYEWMHRSLVHWVVRPSGRKLLCSRSLLRDPDSDQNAWAV